MDPHQERELHGEAKIKAGFKSVYLTKHTLIKVVIQKYKGHLQGK